MELQLVLRVKHALNVHQFGVLICNDILSAVSKLLINYNYYCSFYLAHSFTSIKYHKSCAEKFEFAIEIILPFSMVRILSSFFPPFTMLRTKTHVIIFLLFIFHTSPNSVICSVRVSSQ